MTYLQLMNVLVAFKQVRISTPNISEFVTFCKSNGVYPCGGAIESDGTQWLYIE